MYWPVAEPDSESVHLQLAHNGSRRPALERVSSGPRHCSAIEFTTAFQTMSREFG